MKVWALTILMLSLGWSFAALQTADGGGQPVELLKQRIQPVQLPDKTLRAYSLRTVGASTEIVVTSSNDEGLTWSEPAVVARAPQIPDPWEELLTSVNGSNQISIFLFSRRAIWLLRSSDGGTNWEQVRRIYDGVIAPRPNEVIDSRQRLPASGINNPIGSLSSIQLSSKRILLPITFWANRSFWKGRRGTGPDVWNDMGNYKVSVLYSDDAGVTWNRSPDELKIATPSITQDGAESPVLLEMKDRRVWMLLSSQHGRLFESWSRDGVSWTPPSPSRFYSSEAPASLTRLRNGNIVILWNNCLRHPYAHGGRHVLHAAISKDEGKTWQGFREVYRDPMAEYPLPSEGEFGTGYPQAVETASGKILFSTGQGPSVATLTFDPQWLFETRQTDDFMNGLKSWSVFGTKGVSLANNKDMGGYYAEGAQVMKIQKVDPEWPSAAVWNFPSALRGSLRIKIQRGNTFGGTAVMLTDHFSAPFEEEDRLNALFDLEILADGRLQNSNFQLQPDRWYDLLLKWDFGSVNCEVVIDGKVQTVLPQMRVNSNGASYLRLKSTSVKPDAGISIELVQMKADN